MQSASARTPGLRRRARRPRSALPTTVSVGAAQASHHGDSVNLERLYTAYVLTRTLTAASR